MKQNALLDSEPSLSLVHPMVNGENGTPPLGCDIEMPLAQMDFSVNYCFKRGEGEDDISYTASCYKPLGEEGRVLNLVGSGSHEEIEIPLENIDYFIKALLNVRALLKGTDSLD